MVFQLTHMQIKSEWNWAAIITYVCAFAFVMSSALKKPQQTLFALQILKYL
jgi:bacteriorhodopsin